MESKTIGNGVPKCLVGKGIYGAAVNNCLNCGSPDVDNHVRKIDGYLAYECNACGDHRLLQKIC